MLGMADVRGQQCLLGGWSHWHWQQRSRAQVPLDAWLLISISVPVLSEFWSLYVTTSFPVAPVTISSSVH